MRKLLLIAFVAICAAVGFLSSLDDDRTTQLVMSAVGALFGLAIGGGLLRVGSRYDANRRFDWVIPGMGSSTADLAANYWRDEGHPPFMKPPSPEPDRHQFDPDRIG